MLGLSGMAFASAMMAPQNSSKSGGRTTDVPNWSAGLRVAMCFTSRIT